MSLCYVVHTEDIKKHQCREVFLHLRDLAVISLFRYCELRWLHRVIMYDMARATAIFEIFFSHSVLLPDC